MDLNLIKKTIKEIFGIGNLESDSRSQNTVVARHAYWLLASYFGYSLGQTALAINKNHSTSYNAITRALHMCQTDREYREKIKILFQTLKPYEKTYKRTPERIALFRSAVDAIL